MMVIRIIKRLRLEPEALAQRDMAGEASRLGRQERGGAQDMHSRQDSCFPGLHGVTAGVRGPCEEFFCLRNRVPSVKLQGLGILGKER